IRRLAEDARLLAKRIVAGETGDAMSAGKARRHDHLVAGTPLPPARAALFVDRLDHARGFAAGNDRQGELVSRYPAPHPEVEVVEGHGTYRYDGGTGGWGGGGDIGPLELVDAAVLADENRFHGGDCMARGAVHLKSPWDW